MKNVFAEFMSRRNGGGASESPIQTEETLLREALIDVSKITAAAIMNEMKKETFMAQGRGGQHINKTESAVRVKISIKDARFLSKEQKAYLLQELRKDISKAGYISTESQAERSQFQNEIKAVKRMRELLVQALDIPPDRKIGIPKGKKKSLQEQHQESDRKEKLKRSARGNKNSTEGW